MSPYRRCLSISPELNGYNGQQLGVVISHIERENTNAPT